MMDIEIPWDTIEAAAFDAGLDPERHVCRSYSGRFMYGRTCFGIVGSISEYTEFMLAIERSDEGFEYTNKMAEVVTTDSMGRDMIFYFPGVSILAEDDEIEEGC